MREEKLITRRKEYLETIWIWKTIMTLNNVWVLRWNIFPVILAELSKILKNHHLPIAHWNCRTSNIKTNRKTKEKRQISYKSTTIKLTEMIYKQEWVGKHWSRSFKVKWKITVNWNSITLYCNTSRRGTLNILRKWCRNVLPRHHQWKGY